MCPSRRDGYLPIWPGGSLPKLAPSFYHTAPAGAILICLRSGILTVWKHVPRRRGPGGGGTLYNLLEQFVQAGMIRETKAEGRRRSYILTAKGREALSGEYRRICAQAWDYRAVFGEEKQQ